MCVFVSEGATPRPVGEPLLGGGGGALLMCVCVCAELRVKSACT